jgi:hypothetical protein
VSLCCSFSAASKQQILIISKFIDRQGTYKGTTPDCEGIENRSYLEYRFDFVIKTKYLGKGDGKVFEVLKFCMDKMGSTISLEGLKYRPSQYKVVENRLIQLDMKECRCGDLAEKYVLTK